MHSAVHQSGWMAPIPINTLGYAGLSIAKIFPRKRE
jgi:hypothetical protein